MHAYRADTGFDGERGLPDGVLVLVDAGTIVGVEPGSAAAPAGCEVSYHPGTTLLPGLIDTHTHLCTDASAEAFDRIPGLTPAGLDDVISTSRQAQLAAGITALRDLGDYRWSVVERHRDHPDGPTVVAAGPPVTSVRGHCWLLGGEVAGVAGLRDAVRERADRGADVVKIMASGGVMTPGTDVMDCQFTLPELRAVVDQAHDLGLPVTAHAHGLPAVQQCLAAGVDGIEHCSCITRQGLDAPPELLEALAAAGTFVCPTLGQPPDIDVPPEVAAALERNGLTREGQLEHVGEMYRGGVMLVSGSDSGISPPKPHGVLPLAIEDLVTCGVPTQVALASATGVAARATGLHQRTGRLRAGLDADLLVVDGNPLADIAALHDVRTVVSRGREVDRG